MSEAPQTARLRADIDQPIFEQKMRAVWCELFLDGPPIAPTYPELRRIAEHWRTMEGWDYGERVLAHLRMMRDERLMIAEEFTNFAANHVIARDIRFQGEMREELARARAAKTNHMRRTLEAEVARKVHGYFGGSRDD